MRVYVTGCNGYLGGWVIPKLEDAGHTVLGMDSHNNLIHVTKGKTWDKGILCGLESCRACIALGWYSSVGNGQESLQIESQERVMQLIDRVRKLEGMRFVFPSSASIYGHCADEVVKDDREPNPQCAYGRAKLKVEEYIGDYLKGRHTTFRFGSLMGVGYPGVRTKTELVVNAFAVDGYKRKSIEVWNPEDWKPVIHVRDAADLIVQAISKEWQNGIYNACQKSYRAIDIAKCAESVTRGKVEVVERQGASKRSCRMECPTLRELLSSGVMDQMKRPYETMFEFEEFVESPTDKNTPWTVQPVERV